MNTNHLVQRSIKTATLTSLSIILFAGVCSGADPAAETTDLWDVQIGFPFWASGFEGEVGVLNRSALVDADFDDIFDTLEFGMGLNTEVRYCHHWLFFANMLYVKLENDAQPGGLLGVIDQVELTHQEFDADFGVGYNLFPHKPFRLEPFIGGRVTWLDAELSVSGPGGNAEFDGSKAWADPIVGLFLTFPAGKVLSIFTEADIGGWRVSSDLTWQVNAGGELNLGKHFYTRLTYRHLETDFEDDGFTWDIKKSGPQLEIGFRF